MTKTAGAAANVTTSVGATSKSSCRHDSRQAEGCRESDHDTGGGHAKAVPENHREHLAPCCAKGEPNTDLLAALLDPVRDDAVHADRRQEQRRDRKAGEQHEVEAASPHRSIHDVRHGSRITHRDVRIERLENRPAAPKTCDDVDVERITTLYSLTGHCRYGMYMCGVPSPSSAP